LEPNGPALPSDCTASKLFMSAYYKRGGHARLLVRLELTRGKLMARWTETHADVLHMATVPQNIPMTGIVMMRLRNGSLIEGVIRGMNFGNNGGRGGWSYYGEYEIETISKQRLVIDVLDIESADKAHESRYADYEAAGVITILK
jgi:hypothetical protein